MNRHDWLAAPPRTLGIVDEAENDERSNCTHWPATQHTNVTISDSLKRARRPVLIPAIPKSEVSRICAGIDDRVNEFISAAFRSILAFGSREENRTRSDEAEPTQSRYPDDHTQIEG